MTLSFILLLYAPFIFVHYLLLAFTFHAIFIFAHLSIYFLVIFILLPWAFLFFFLRYLIINMNHKIFNDTWTIWLLSSVLWSIGLFGLRIRNLGLWLETLWSYLIILSRALEVYLKTLGYLFVLCAGYCDYTLCL